jgi:glycosyltransferase involved in cell wall biosynthesis
MKYIVVNPLPATNVGIDSYSKFLKTEIEKRIGIEYLENNKNLPFNEFRIYVKEYIESRYGYEEVIIEAPEAKSATLLLNRKYKVHIRLHCPLYVAQKYNEKEINYTEYSNELLAISKAWHVSSPSFGLLKELENDIPTKGISVYKNPIPWDLAKYRKEFNDKEFDVVVLGRFQTLKGIQYLNFILEHLPSDKKVVLIGANSMEFKLSPYIKAKVITKGHIGSDHRFELLSKSKVSLCLSKFENCSCVILESIAVGTRVLAWDVGGNKELAKDGIVDIIPAFDIRLYAAKLNNLLKHGEYPSYSSFKFAMNKIHSDFAQGLNHVVNGAKQNQLEAFRGISNLQKVSSCKLEFSTKEQVIPIRKNESKLFGERVFGFSISNEHIEELWMPIIEKLGLDYRFVSRRPLGYHSVFNNPFEVDEKKYSVYDWIANPDRLIRNIISFKPNKILFHNGQLLQYQAVLQKVKSLGIPIIYSELGWLPQKDNVYFDLEGVNARSSLARLDRNNFSGHHIRFPKTRKSSIRNNDVLILLQLENDTNILYNSPKFKSNIAFIEAIANSKKVGKIYIRPHPKDKNTEKYTNLISEKIILDTISSLDSLLKKVSSVAGFNSTALIEALYHDVNIYLFGYGILNNKEVAIDCTETDLDDAWQDKIYASKKVKMQVVDGFLNRQIHIPTLNNLSEKEILSSLSFEPFLVANQENFTSLISLESRRVLNKLQPPVFEEISPAKRKMRKLKRTPLLFFRDYFKKRFYFK